MNLKNFKESIEDFYTEKSFEYDCTSSDTVLIAKMIAEAPKFDNITKASLLEQFFKNDVTVKEMVNTLIEEGY